MHSDGGDYSIAHIPNYQFTQLNNSILQVFKDWVVVDSKKKNQKNKTKKQIPPTPTVEGLNDPLDPLKLSGLISQKDYAGRKKSKKSSRKQKRQLEDLAASLSGLNASSTPATITAAASDDSPVDSKLRGVHRKSTVIKKKKNKNRKSKRRHREEDHGSVNVDEDVVLDVPQPTEDGNEIRNPFLKESSTNADAIDGAKEVKVQYSGKKEKSKKRKREVEVVPDLSDDDDIDLKHGKLAEQIEKEIQKRPNKKVKVVVENITPFQSKHLAKAGIAFVEKKEVENGARKKQERKVFARMARKMAKSMSLEEDGDDQ